MSGDASSQLNGIRWIFCAVDGHSDMNAYSWHPYVRKHALEDGFFLLDRGDNFHTEKKLFYDKIIVILTKNLII